MLVPEGRQGHCCEMQPVVPSMSRQVLNGVFVMGYIQLAYSLGHPVWLFAIYIVGVFSVVIIQVRCTQQ